MWICIYIYIYIYIHTYLITYIFKQIYHLFIYVCIYLFIHLYYVYIIYAIRLDRFWRGCTDAAVAVNRDQPPVETLGFEGPTMSIEIGH